MVKRFKKTRTQGMDYELSQQNGTQNDQGPKHVNHMFCSDNPSQRKQEPRSQYPKVFDMSSQ